MAAFDHEGAQDHEPAEFGVAEGVAQVELGHVVLAPVEVAVGPGRRLKMRSRACRPNPVLVFSFIFN